MVFSTALSFGFLGAVIASMKGFFGGSVAFHFSILTVIGFILGALAGWLLWKIFLRGKRSPD
jgi:hypothetical protein